MNLHLLRLHFLVFPLVLFMLLLLVFSFLSCFFSPRPSPSPLQLSLLFFLLLQLQILFNSSIVVQYSWIDTTRKVWYDSYESWMSRILLSSHDLIRFESNDSSNRLHDFLNRMDRQTVFSSRIQLVSIGHMYTLLLCTSSIFLLFHNCWRFQMFIIKAIFVCAVQSFFSFVGKRN